MIPLRTVIYSQLCWVLPNSGSLLLEWRKKVSWLREVRTGIWILTTSYANISLLIWASAALPFSEITSILLSWVLGAGRRKIKRGTWAGMNQPAPELHPLSRGVDLHFLLYKINNHVSIYCQASKIALVSPTCFYLIFHSPVGLFLLMSYYYFSGILGRGTVKACVKPLCLIEVSNILKYFLILFYFSCWVDADPFRWMW